MAWILIPCLIQLRNEFNQLAPGRDKSSDGSIGDGEHSQNSSDHNPDETGKTPTKDADSKNEVHAIDVDRDLKLDGVTMEDCVQLLIRRHKAGDEDRLQNIIFNRRIWSRSWGWTPKPYSGPNPHDHHAHFSARYTTAQESSTRAWGLLSLRPKTQEDDVSAWTEDIIPNPSWRSDAKTNPTVAAKYALYDAWNQAHSAGAKVDALSKKVDAVLAAVSGLNAKDFTDEAAIAKAVLDGLDPAKIAAAIPADTAQRVVDLLMQRLAS